MLLLQVVLPVAPLPGVPLPLTSSPGSLVSFGPDPPLASLWCLLALYERLGQGPVSVVFLRGQVLLQPEILHFSSTKLSVDSCLYLINTLRMASPFSVL